MHGRESPGIDRRTGQRIRDRFSTSSTSICIAFASIPLGAVTETTEAWVRSRKEGFDCDCVMAGKKTSISKAISQSGFMIPLLGMEGLKSFRSSRSFQEDKRRIGRAGIIDVHRSEKQDSTDREPGRLY
jgi:hypothetical protein